MAARCMHGTYWYVANLQFEHAMLCDIHDIVECMNFDNHNGQRWYTDGSINEQIDIAGILFVVQIVYNWPDVGIKFKNITLGYRNYHC